MKKASFFKTLPRLIQIQFRATPWDTAVNMVMAAVHALAYTATIVATTALFDAIALAAAGQAGFVDCVLPLLALAAATFGQHVMNGVANFHFYFVFGKTTGKTRTLLHQKLLAADAALFEDTAFLDDANKAKEGAGLASMFCLDFLGIFFFYGVYFASVGAYLFRLSPVLVFTLLLSFVPALLAQMVQGKVFTLLEEENAPLRRRYEYYQKALCDREYFKETRILGAFSYFHRLFTDTLQLLARKTWQAERKTALLQLLLNITSFAGMAVSSYLLFTLAMAGTITLGAFAAVFSALGTLFSIMQEVVAMHIGNMSKDLGKVANFVRMLDLPQRDGATGSTPNFTKGITAKNISFTYPGRDTAAVRDVSLAIAAGETIAIVGENGAGKSTLVRLLTGLYRPAEGTVAVGGLDTAQTAPAALYKSTSGVFQKFQRYKMTLAENVAISDTGAAPDTGRITAALHEADARLDVPPDTILSPEFDGIDLSGGQWQRLAIARGLYRKSGFIVLDEPTSAIDPIEETRIYTQFQRLAQGKCAVIVTHRLGSAKLANRIVVMDAGQIVAMGTHKELVARPGKYADMWAAQAEWYERPEGARA